MKKGIRIIICMALCFAFLIVGVYIGRKSLDGSFVVDASGNHGYEPTDPSIENAFLDQKININTAGMDELSLLPNIGEQLAGRIISYREQNGRFSAIEDLMNVEGIGENRLSLIRKYITVGGAS